MTEINDLEPKLEEPTGTGQEKTEKTFSQEEVQKLIQERVRREKSSFDKEKGEFSQREADYLDQIKKYEDTLQKMISSQMESLPESVKKLLSKLSVFEQLEWLSDSSNLIQKKNIPSTPKENPDNKEIKPRKINQIF